ncbi:unnamed protein product [Ectocarpus fasciculatus]
MSLQGSIHTWSDGIGYGAFMPTDRAYFNVRTPRASVRRPSSENVRDYRRNNVTAGIDTHRSDVSFGRTTESIRGGVDGDSRAREATKSLTSGEVGGFCWPAERARGGDVETILASSAVAAASNGSAMASSRLVSARGESKLSSMPPMMLSARSVKQREQDAEKNVLSARRRRTPSNGSSGGSTQRSDSTCAPSSSSSIGSYNSSRAPASFRPSPSSPGDQQENSGRRSISSSRSRARRPISYDAAHRVGVAPGMPQLQLSHRSRGAHSSRSNGNSSARERRLRPPSLTAQDAMLPAPSSAAKTPRFRSLDPVFDRHHKYDLVAEERAAEGMVVTGRFGPVQGPSVLAASLLTSELSTPWSHVLRGQKW